MSGEDRYLFEYVIELLQDVEPLEDITAKIDSVVYTNKTQVGEDDA